MYKSRCHGLISDISKDELLKMREGGMSNAAIAASLGCHKNTVYRVIGAQPREMTAKAISEGKLAALHAPCDGGYTVERKMKSFMPKQQEEPAKVVLVVKTLPPAPIPLHGEAADYTISADRQTVEIENELGRVLMQLPAEKIPTFIEELTAIQKNIGSEKPMAFWG
jgi:hypothetical protein